MVTLWSLLPEVGQENKASDTETVRLGLIPGLVKAKDYKNCFFTALLIDVQQ